MKIMIAADGSSHTQHLLAYVAAHDEWLGTRHEYTVLNVVPFLPPRATALAGDTATEAYYCDEAERVLEPIRAFFKEQGLTADFVAQHGNVADVIARQAELGKFDLLMMGSRGHGSLVNVIMGSVATQVLARCKVPALLVR
ncbi:MAG: universal stress protein [Rhizobacter sp.]|nr:universal stress protein [Rhizobacter sp.]